MNAPRLLIALGSVLFVVGCRLDWLDSESFGSVAPHHLLRVGAWVYLPVVPVLLAPLAPARWLVLLATGWLLLLGVAGFVLATAGDVQPAWPYNGTAETAHPGLFLSMAGVVVALAGIYWALGSDAGPLPARRWLAVVGGAVAVAAAFPLYADLRGEAEERRIEQHLADENPDADVDVVCRGETPNGPNCAWRYERDGAGAGGSLSETR